MANYFVKIPGQGTCSFELPLEECNVKNLVNAVSARSDALFGGAGGGGAFNNEDLKLFYGGKQIGFNHEKNSNNNILNSNVPLLQLGINPGSTLEVNVPLLGGAQCGKMVKGRSKEKPQNDELAAKLKWLQEQAAGRIAGKT